MQDEYAVIEKVLKNKCSRGPVYYLPNPGNWGDGLIRYGTLKFFSDINLKFKELTRNKKDWLIPILKGGTVIYGGGGGWCKLWNKSPADVTKLKRRFNVIVLPSTYESSYSIPNTMFFCRDTFESKNNMPDAIFCHDMAFYIGKQFFRGNKGVGDGYFFRSDPETANKIKIPPNNNDISLKGNYRSEVFQFFNEINRFSAIFTDRLHVSIAACLLKKEVHLYPGAYFKNRAVYLSSMKSQFENVCFHEDFDF